MCNRLFLLLSGALLSYSVHAQNYSYSVSKDSASYQLLGGASTIAGTESWQNKHFGLHLPFQFNIAGTATDSLQIDNNGFITFATASHTSLVAFNSYTANMDTSGVYRGLISYTLEGTSGGRILKIQLAGLSENKLSGGDYLGYQVWLYEGSNAIEFHVGPNAHSLQQDSEIAFPVLMGIINRNMDAATNGYLVTGSVDAPSGLQLVSDNLQYLVSTPYAGSIYRLTPTF